MRRPLAGQYTSYAFGKRCQEAGVMPSMGSTGDAYDNAMAESFFATLEREVLDRSAPSAVPESGRGATGHLPVAGGLVQSAPAPLRPRLPVTHQLREETVAAERLKPKSVPVHGTGAGPLAVWAGIAAGTSIGIVVLLLFSGALAGKF